MIPLAYRTSESGGISIIFEQVIHRFNKSIVAVQCNFLTDILDLVHLRFAENVQRVYLCTDVTAASWMLEPFGEVGEMFLNIFHWDKIFNKMMRYKVIEKK